MRDRIALAGAALLVAVPALLPYHREPMLGFYQDALAIAFGLVAALPVLWPRRDESIPVPAIALGLYALAAIIALQAALGRVAFVESSATGVLYCAWAGVVVMAGARLREILGAERVALVLQRAFAAGGFLLAITGFMQLYGITVGGLSIASVTTHMVSATGQPGYLANILACALASLAALAAARRLHPATAALAAAPMVVALALSAARIAWVFAAIIPACALAARSSRREALGVAVLFAAAACAVAAGWLGEVTTAAERFALSAEGGQVESVRRNLAALAWHAFSSQPLLGVGWGEFAWSGFLEAPALEAPGRVVIDRHAHNLVLQLLAETGIAGASVIAAPLAAWCWRHRRPTPASAWVVTVAAIHLAQAMVELPHWYAYLLGPLALVLGLGASEAARVHFPGLGRLAARAALVLAIAAGGARISDYRALERWVAHARAGVLTPESYRELDRLARTAFAPEATFMAAQLPSGAGAAEQLSINGRAMRFAPTRPLAVRRAELLEQLGRRGEAAAIRRSTLAVYGPGVSGVRPVLLPNSRTKTP